MAERYQENTGYEVAQPTSKITKLTTAVRALVAGAVLAFTPACNENGEPIDPKPPVTEVVPPTTRILEDPVLDPIEGEVYFGDTVTITGVVNDPDATGADYSIDGGETWIPIEDNTGNILWSSKSDGNNFSFDVNIGNTGFEVLTRATSEVDNVEDSDVDGDTGTGSVRIEAQAPAPEAPIVPDTVEVEPDAESFELEIGIPEYTEYIHILDPNGNEVFDTDFPPNAATVNLFAATVLFTGEGTYTVVAGNNTGEVVVNVEVAWEAPTISNLEIDCSEHGECVSGGYNYPVTFDVQGATEYNIELEVTSGIATYSGEVNTPNGQIEEDGTISLLYNTAQASAGNSIRLTITTIGLGGATSRSLEFHVY